MGTKLIKLKQCLYYSGTQKRNCKPIGKRGKKEEDDEGEHLKIISIYMKCKKNHTRTVVIDQMQLVKTNSAIV